MRFIPDGTDVIEDKAGTSNFQGGKPAWITLISDGTGWHSLTDGNLYNMDGALRYYRLYVTSISASSASSSYASVAEWQFKIGSSWLTNAMTSDSTGHIGGYAATISASSTYMSNHPYYAFDGESESSESHWFSDEGGFSLSAPYDGLAWLMVDFGQPVPISGIRIKGMDDSRTTNNYWSPDVFKVQGSSNGADWVDLGWTISSGVKTHSRTHEILAP